MGFNPHARVGRDQFYKVAEFSIDVSIHTPVWGVTFFKFFRHFLCWVSIHTPVWGVTV